MKQISKILKSLPEWLRNTRTPEDVSEEFLLSYQDLLIGQLVLDKGKWRFQYSEEFKLQSELTPLMDFPDPEKVYEEDELWKFFAVRIPNPDRPGIREIIEKEKIAKDNLVELLKRFGKATITNPYVLKEA